jgi:hypothetical protein
VVDVVVRQDDVVQAEFREAVQVLQAGLQRALVGVPRVDERDLAGDEHQVDVGGQRPETEPPAAGMLWMRGVSSMVCPQGSS